MWSPAVCLAVRGENQRARDLFTEGLEIAIHLDNHAWRASLACNVIDMAIEMGDLATAAQHLRSALPSSDPSLAVYLVEAAAILAIQRGDNDVGLRLLGAGRSMLTRSGYRETRDEAERRQRWIGVARSGMQPDDADANWDLGLALSIAGAQEQARAVVDPETGAAGAASAVDTSANVFAREGKYWSLAYGGVVTRVRDSKGMRDIARLLATQGRGVAAVDLVAGDEPPARRDAASAEARRGLQAEADAGEVIDAAARARTALGSSSWRWTSPRRSVTTTSNGPARARTERDFLVERVARRRWAGGPTAAGAGPGRAGAEGRHMASA